MFKIKQIIQAQPNWQAWFESQDQRTFAGRPIVCWALLEDNFQQKVVGMVIDPYTNKIVTTDEVKDLNGELLPLADLGYADVVEEYYRESN